MPNKVENWFLGLKHHNHEIGWVPSSLGNLSNLQELGIQGASLTGHIPSSIFNISSLESLFLYNNSLSGNLPAGMCHYVPNLVILNLESNQLTGHLWDKLSGCKRLSVLALANNKFIGDIPKHVGNLTTLTLLNLYGSYFIGELPAELGGLNLKEFVVGNNRLFGSIPISLFNISTMQIMSFSENSFSGELPSTMGLSLPNLQQLYLNVNKLSGVIPSSISNASALFLLEMSGNSFSGSVPDFSNLQPSNILLNGEMAARVGDFGISKIVGEVEWMTQTKTLATIGYMAPEYGSEGIVSASADVYSFGIVLLEICTRKKPTDEMFGDEMSLKKWVSLSIDENAMIKVVDNNLFGDDDRNFLAKEQCLSSILCLAMECVAFLPSERINMSKVVAKLKKIKLCFQQTGRI